MTVSKVKRVVKKSPAENPVAEVHGNDESKSVFQGVSTNEFAGYVFDNTKIFVRQSKVRDLDFLTYLLEMVAVEAARLRDEP